MTQQGSKTLADAADRYFVIPIEFRPEPPWRAGILTVVNEFLENIERVLPPEHRIQATREGVRYAELIITGPHMPVAIGGKPEKVELLLTTFHDDDGGYRLAGSWHQWDTPGDPLATWEIGKWPTLEEMREFLDRATPLNRA